MRKAILIMAVSGLLAVPVMADSVGIMDPAGFGVDYKTPPLANSDVFSVPISYHSTFAFTNWAGVILDITIDQNPAEAHFWGAVGRPADGVPPGGAGFFPTFSGLGGTYPPGYTVVTFWSNNAMLSGTTPATTPLGSSDVFNLGMITFHASNTDPQYNSDVDIVFSAWNIFHVTPDQSTMIWEVPASIWLYGPVEGEWYPTEPGQGIWWHNPDTFTVHVQNSMFWATTAWISAVGSIGVEHIPEPAAVAFVLMGLGVLVAARRR
jgi:hypothetical protein